MPATFQGRVTDESLYPALEAIAELYGLVERKLYVDLYVRGQRWQSCKSAYLKRFGLTGRQFNAIRATLDGKIDSARRGLLLRASSLRESVDATAKTVAKLTRQLKALRKGLHHGKGGHDAEQAELRQRTASCLHQKQRRLQDLRGRLAAVEDDRKAGRVHLCFGGKRLFHRQFALRENGYPDHAAWLQDWRRARSSQFFCIGSKGETAGNQTCTRQPDGSLRLRVPPALSARFERWLIVPPVRFPYGQDVLDMATATKQTVSFRFIRGHRKGRETWYVHATVEVAPAAVTTRLELGALGVDLNPAHVDVAAVDRFGNPLHAQRIAVAVQGRRQEQVEAALAEAAADIVAQAKSAGKPVVIERLDFREKKARLREAGPRRARMLSGFAYRCFHRLLHSRAAREGVQVVEVNPAYTSVIGFAKFGSGYGLSPHASAALAIARRGLRFGERLRSRSAFPLPARNRGRHVWSDWRRVAQRLRAERARGRRPSEGGRGRGIPLSAAAPAAHAPQGPPRDGLATVPGCDPPAQIVGSAVRPAS